MWRKVSAFTVVLICCHFHGSAVQAISFPGHLGMNHMRKTGCLATTGPPDVPTPGMPGEIIKESLIIQPNIVRQGLTRMKKCGSIRAVSSG